ncbi:MAG: hypothetical protein AAGF53_06165 [Pseudomonadota bacterium]
MRITIHPGFHKTGTSSLQKGLVALSEPLAPHLRFALLPDMLELVRAARRFSRSPSAQHLNTFGKHMATWIAKQDQNDPRPLVISAEDLSGHTPGKFEITDYSAAPKLMQAAVSALRVANPKVDIDVWFTTRDPEPWLRSVYYQLLRATRMTDGLNCFAKAHQKAAALDRVVEQTEDLLGNVATTGATRLEVLEDTPLGPLGALLERLGIDDTELPPIQAQNVQPTTAAKELLALNRSNLSDEELAAAKRKVIRGYMRRGDTKRTVVA